ncbi:MAG TPA: recombinase family protein, partial [Roseimicrobium sp.]|nr:recombinase family protein [Roseimicrobium sp.]
MNDIRAVALTSGHPNQPAVHPVTDLSTKRTQPLQASPAGGGPAVVTAGAPAANGPKAFPADNHESGFPMEPDQPAAALSSLFGKLPAAPVEVAQTSEGPLPFGPRPSRPAGQCVRTPRKRPNLIPKKLRGLPSDSDLEKLATAYVRFQNKAWPAFVADGTLPPLTQELIQLMVEDFKVRHMTGQVNMAGAPKSGVTLGTEYLRYSCDLSNPLSLEDQQNNILVKARQADVFVGWFGVFADAGVSGADPSRQGYSSLKVAIATIPELKVIFLDDFSRGGRNIFEWWVLATLVSSTGKNILTADGSFDLSGSFGMMLLSVFGFFSKHFLEQLSGKVLRGMRGAARRDGVVGRLPLGYGMLPMVDAQGNLKLDPEGQVMNTWLVHLATSCYVLRAGEMYGEEGKSPREIADYFNENMVDGSNRWTASSIRRLLWNPMYIGVYIYNRLRTVVDPQSGKRKRLENPRSQWDIRHDKDWAIWPEPLYRKVRRRLYAAGVESPNFGRRRRNRDSNAVTSWFTDVGICACGNRLYATRGGENASLACLKGRSNLNDCTMDSAKAARIVEEELLDHIMTHLLRKNVSLRVAVMANSYVDRLAAQPAANTTALEAERDDLKLEQQRYIKLVGTGHFDVSAEDGDGLA